MASSCVPPSGSAISLGALHAGLGAPFGTFWARPKLPFIGGLTDREELLSLKGMLVPGIVPIIPARPFFRGGDRRQSARDADCLTAAVYYEARSEDEAGQRAVAQVVLNRLRHYAFPGTICAVVYEGSRRRTGCQFSFTCDGSMKREREPRAWRRAERIAAEALSGYVHAPVGHATHYHTDEVSPVWAPTLQPVTSIGSHLFYRWRGRAGEPHSFSERGSALPQRPAKASVALISRSRMPGSL